MAQTFSEASSPDSAASTSTQRPSQLAIKACQDNDISLLTQAIALASSSNSRESVQQILARAVRSAIGRNATKVLSYALACGGEVPPNYPHLDIEGPSKDILEILLTNGWNINGRRIGGRPFLWDVVGDGDLVTWCLEHGTTTTPKDPDDSQREHDQCPPILEVAASLSTVATFELLRSKGGQQGRRTLHFAARAAVKSGNDGGEQSEMLDRNRAKLHSERMAMVIHLVDGLGIDSNQLDQPQGWTLGNHWGTPLCYVAQTNLNWDCSDVLQFLLQRGADPELVIDPAGWDSIELAKKVNNQRFLHIVENWKTNYEIKNI